MEHIMASQLMRHLDKHNILYKLQHGFRSKFSCETQLLEFTDSIFKSLCNNQQSDVIIMDFSKAFDKVCRQRLLYKLKSYGANDIFCNWVKSFLSGRTQQVVIDGECSNSVSVTSGVPQGSVLGPILFLVFINDMPTYTKHATIRLFADDTIAYLTITSHNNCIQLQNDLVALERWEKEWMMEFHPDKCNIMHITKKRTTLKYPYKLHTHLLTEASDSKYLGININNKMSWNKHIDSVSAKANKRLGFIKRNLKIPNKEIKSRAYK
jgi:ribonuclease P/MRP protein subunit RPP40